MPAASQQQQKLMGIVSALQKGDMKPSQASGKAKEMAKSMKKGDVKDFASTKHKGLPKKVKKEDYDPTKMYVVLRPVDNLDAAGLIKELNPLQGLAPLNVNMEDVISVTADASQAQEIAAEAYKKYMEESFQLEEKKGKVGDKLKKTIDHLEKKRKEHIDMAKEDPKSSSQHKEHIAKLASQIDDLMSKMEKIERSKKNVEKKEEKKDVEKKDLKESIKSGVKKHVTNLLQEQDPVTPPPAAKTGDVKNPVDTKSELQKYFRDLSVKVSGLKGADTKEIQSFATLINGIIQDLGDVSLSPTLQQVIKFYDTRTKGIEPKG